MEDISSKCTGHYSSKFRTFYSRRAARLMRTMGQPITFDNKHISQRTGKKIPLDPGTNEPHDCPVRRNQPQQQQGQSQQSYQQQQPQQSQQQRRYHQCNKGCGKEIYFDANHSKSQSGKWIPIDKETELPHQCQ
jgi:hypothetical protein